MIGAKAPAKINLVFEVGPKRADGYHDVLSLYQSLDLFEEVFVEPSDSWQISVAGDLPPEELALVPQDDSNLVMKAAKLIALKAGIQNPQPMQFKIVKRIPAAAGLAGGSADAAAALVALNEAWCLGFCQSQLMDIAAELGADVPFSLLGGTAIGTDSGIVLEPRPPLPKEHVLLIFSKPGISTTESFEVFDRLYPQGDITLEGADLENPSELFGRNSLLAPALELRPDLATIMELVPSKVHLSGSGPTLYQVGTKSEMLLSQQVFRADGFETLITQFANQGAELI